MNSMETTSTRPYLIRAIYEWCADNGMTPYISVAVDSSVQVPLEFVSNNEIVLNISCDSTGDLKLGNEFIEFKARFGGVLREIFVPVERITAIYAKESGQGMSFPLLDFKTDDSVLSASRYMEKSELKKSQTKLPVNPKAGSLSSVKSTQLLSDAKGDGSSRQPPKSGTKLKLIK